MKIENKKGFTISVIITIVLSILIGILFLSENELSLPDSVYQIYLDGEKIGLIESKDDLYDLINSEQKEIRDTYNVDQVYPPNGFSIEKYDTYATETTTINDIYNKIKEEKDFTVKGYTISIKSKDENIAPKYIYVLDRDVFEQAIYNFITVFVNETQYRNYINGTQPEIVDVGEIINNMYFDETLTIKESYISVDETIFTNVEDLSHYLLFGLDSKRSTYTVKKGDTIETIAYDNKLNVQEFLIANQNITDENTILAIGQEVVIELIDPQISLVYESEVVEDQEVPYETETIADYSKVTGYRVVEQQGITGINRITKQIQVTNGAENEGAYIDDAKTITIRAPQNEKVRVGRKSYNMGTYIDTGTSWAWPTNSPYVFTSPYGYRGGEFHAGQDISGTGLGSPIYAIGDGVVISAQWGGMVGDSAGKNVVIQHPNGYYSIYAHLNDINVKVGQTVSRKQKIGTMGKTGVASGVHLHLSITVGGPPYKGGSFINPLRLWNLK